MMMKDCITLFEKEGEDPVLSNDQLNEIGNVFFWGKKFLESKII